MESLCILLKVYISSIDLLAAYMKPFIVCTFLNSRFVGNYRRRKIRLCVRGESVCFFLLDAVSRTDGLEYRKTVPGSHPSLRGSCRRRAKTWNNLQHYKSDGNSNSYITLKGCLCCDLCYLHDYITGTKSGKHGPWRRRSYHRRWTEKC